MFSIVVSVVLSALVVAGFFVDLEWWQNASRAVVVLQGLLGALVLIAFRVDPSKFQGVTRLTHGSIVMWLASGVAIAASGHFWWAAADIIGGAMLMIPRAGDK